MKKLSLLLVLACSVGATGCSPVTYVGMKFLYRKSDLPTNQVFEDLCFDPFSSCDTFHRLDLFRPAGRGWPTIVFVHGGGWDGGDKKLRVGGADVYSNIGRFYAAHGIGVAVINYGLQPKTDWMGQLKDVRAALAWIDANIETYGGERSKIFLMGHSAGAHLAALAALDGKSPETQNLRGVIAVSGAALDLTDQTTYDMGEKQRYYEKRFKGKAKGDEWKAAPSPVTYVTPEAPPFLILYAGGETKGLQRQSQLLHQALTGKGVASEVVVVPKESHSKIVLTLSREDKAAVPAILKFIRDRQ